jgi:hypothetical protein
MVALEPPGQRPDARGIDPVVVGNQDNQ